MLPKRTAEARLVKRYHKLYVPLIELIQALQDLEPGTMLIDNAEFSETNKNIHVEYKAKPIQLMINTDSQLSKDARSIVSPTRKDTHVA